MGGVPRVRPKRQAGAATLESATGLALTIGGLAMMMTRVLAGCNDIINRLGLGKRKWVIK